MLAHKFIKLPTTLVVGCVGQVGSQFGQHVAQKAVHFNLLLFVLFLGNGLDISVGGVGLTVDAISTTTTSSTSFKELKNLSMLC